MFLLFSPYLIIFSKPKSVVGALDMMISEMSVDGPRQPADEPGHDQADHLRAEDARDSWVRATLPSASALSFECLDPNAPDLLLSWWAQHQSLHPEVCPIFSAC